MEDARREVRAYENRNMCLVKPGEVPDVVVGRGSPPDLGLKFLNGFRPNDYLANVRLQIAEPFAFETADGETLDVYYDSRHFSRETIYSILSIRYEMADLEDEEEEDVGLSETMDMEAFFSTVPLPSQKDFSEQLNAVEFDEDTFGPIFKSALDGLKLVYNDEDVDGDDWLKFFCREIVKGDLFKQGRQSKSKARREMLCEYFVQFAADVERSFISIKHLTKWIHAAMNVGSVPTLQKSVSTVKVFENYPNVIQAGSPIQRRKKKKTPQSSVSPGEKRKRMEPEPVPAKKILVIDHEEKEEEEEQEMEEEEEEDEEESLSISDVNSAIANMQTLRTRIYDDLEHHKKYKKAVVRKLNTDLTMLNHSLEAAMSKVTDLQNRIKYITDYRDNIISVKMDIDI